MYVLTAGDPRIRVRELLHVNGNRYNRSFRRRARWWGLWSVTVSEGCKGGLCECKERCEIGGYVVGRCLLRRRAIPCFLSKVRYFILVGFNKTALETSGC